VENEKRPAGGTDLVDWRLNHLEDSVDRHLNDCVKYREKQNTKLNYAIAFLFTIALEALLIIWRLYVNGQ